mmetsp:Transcript_56541/g.143009  ORF Transcript_56541/g.143009 Transcript_56541/m.143009 type:complete len:201 (+) Transcript_56541:310-912(+)
MPMCSGTSSSLPLPTGGVTRRSVAATSFAPTCSRIRRPRLTQRMLAGMTVGVPPTASRLCSCSFSACSLMTTSSPKMATTSTRSGTLGGADRARAGSQRTRFARSCTTHRKRPMSSFAVSAVSVASTGGSRSSTNRRPHLRRVKERPRRVMRKMVILIAPMKKRLGWRKPRAPPQMRPRENPRLPSLLRGRSSANSSTRS